MLLAMLIKIINKLYSHSSSCFVCKTQLLDIHLITFTGRPCTELSKLGGTSRQILEAALVYYCNCKSQYIEYNRFAVTPVT